MQGTGTDAAVVDRVGKPWVSVPADTLSIVPSTPGDGGTNRARANPACPEIDCVLDWLPDGILAAAARRAADLGVGADRVLLASGLIAEDDYVQALAWSCGVVFEPLTDTPRSACPLTDDQLIESVAAGLLPLQIDGNLVVIVAPRVLAARRMAGVFASNRDLTRRYRFTSAQRLRQFVTKHGNEALGRRAADKLKLSQPALSAAPRAREPFHMTLIWLAAMAGMLLAAPSQIVATINVTLAAIFLAWIVLRLFGSVVKHPQPNRRLSVDDDKLPVYTIIAALYREATSVENLVASLRQLDYPGIMAQTPQRCS
jgi:hypothetical protein